MRKVPLTTRRRRLSDDEKWGPAVADEWHGLVRPRIRCQKGEPAIPYSCARYATWKVGRKNLCGQHAKIATGE